MPGGEETLLEHGANPDASDINGFTSLHIAAQQGRVSLMQLLLRSGASANLPTADGRSPLMLSCSLSPEHHSVSASVLIKAGADVHAVTPAGWTPLHFACQAAHGQMAALLVRAGAQPDVAAKDGATPLDCCPEGPAKEAVRAALLAGQ